MRDCQNRDGGTWNDAARSARGCTRAGLYPVRRKPTADGLYELTFGTAYMGRYPDRALEGEAYLGMPVNWQQPLEDPAEGCPGAQYRVEFVDSLDPYIRRRTETGDRVANPAFDAADGFVQSAAMHFEHEQERWLASLHGERARRDKALREKADRK